MGKITKSVIILFCVILNGCASSRVTTVRGLIPKGINIALAPSGGILAEAIGIELFNRGFTVIDTNEMSNLMMRYNLTEIEISKPQNLQTLKQAGIDAIMTVKSVSGVDNKPQSASVRLNSTDTWEIIAGVSWENGWGGQAGSVLDRSKRKDITGAAEEIANALLTKNLEWR